VTGLEFPGRAVLLSVTFLLYPAVLSFGGIVTTLVDEEKIYLPFDVEGYRPPALFIALYGF
jgi:hypothetical protein